MKMALRIAYDGTGFHGSAYQPNLRTVESEMKNRLIAMGAFTDESTANLKMASRTDRGVSAAGNVCVFTTDMDPDSLLSGLVYTLQGIWVVGVAIVNEGFNPRHTHHKTYQYFVPENGLDIEAMRRAANVFVGQHNVSSFARVDHRNPLRTITCASVDDDDVTTITFVGPSFLWYQIRRMVAAVIMVGREKASPSDIKRVLEQKEPTPWGTASPEYLLLTSISYNPVIRFQLLPAAVSFLALRKREMAARFCLFNKMYEKVQETQRNK